MGWNVLTRGKSIGWNVSTGGGKIALSFAPPSSRAKGQLSSVFTASSSFGGLFFIIVLFAIALFAVVLFAIVLFAIVLFAIVLFAIALFAVANLFGLSLAVRLRLFFVIVLFPFIETAPLYLNY
jgi:hypothetical protein